MAYEESIIIPGGKIITNNAMAENSISFKRVVIENDDPNLKRDFIEVNCKIIIDNYANFIKVIEDFDMNNSTAVEKIKKTNNLLILGTNKDNKHVYTLKLQKCNMVPSFNKNKEGQIVLTLNSKDIDKIDHASGPKIDHPAFPKSS